MSIDSKTTIIVFKEPAKAAQVGNQKSLVDICEAIRSNAVVLCPVDKGQLRNTITYALDNNVEGPFNDAGLLPAPAEQRLDGPSRQNNTRVRGYVGTNSDHWFPEFGTLRQVAQPFLRPAFDQVVRGGTASSIIAKYGREAMVREFNVRRTVK